MDTKLEDEIAELNEQTDDLEKQVGRFADELARKNAREEAEAEAKKAALEQRAPRKHEFEVGVSGGASGPTSGAPWSGAHEAGVKSLTEFAEMARKGAIGASYFDTTATATLASKALGDSTGAAGGFIVQGQPLEEVVTYLRAASPVRRLVPIVPVTGYPVPVPVMATGFNAAAWVGEGATKPSSDFTLSQLNVLGYTAAHIARASLQLIRRARGEADTLIASELGGVIGAIEDLAYVNGSGTAQPRGILNVVGVNTATVAAGATAAAQLEAIRAMVFTILRTSTLMPDAILMHSRRLAFLSGATDTTGRYLMEGALLEGGFTRLFGLPVEVDDSIPTNFGAGTNEDRIVVARFAEMRIYQEQPFTIDTWDEAGTAFERNERLFRGESTVGFTAERRPKTIGILSGPGLV